MMKKVLVFALLCMGIAGASFASTGSNPEIINYSQNVWGDQNSRATVLLIQTTDSAVGAAITACGETYDLYYGEDFSGVDLSGYEHVFLAMDGGMVTDASIANAAGYVNGGGNFHIYGGTCWQEYAIAMNNYLVGNDINNYCWQTVYGTPHSTIVDAGHYLAQGLPATYNYVNYSATYYSLRTTDGALAVAAVNGDGYNHLFSKVVGAGMVDACLNSSYASYWADPSDFAWMTQVVCNMLGGGNVPTQNTTWGRIRASYR